MKSREALLLVLVVAAAFAAAIAFRTAVHPGGLHDPRHAEEFDRARELLPVLGAVRVRSAEQHAAHRLDTAPESGIRRVLSPAKAEAVFRYGRLLYATSAEVEEAVALLRRGEVPPLPPQPDIGHYYRDARGAYACDVILDEDAGPDVVQAILPDAELSGEPVARADETHTVGLLQRALLASLVASCIWAVSRGGAVDMEARLLAALLSVLVLAAAGWGVDVWTLPALIVVAGAPRGLPLLAAAPCLFFPSLALKRIGLVFLVGGVARLAWWRARKDRPAIAAGEQRGWRRVVVVHGALAALGGILLAVWPVRAQVPDALRGEPAVTFVPRGKAFETAKALRAAGVREVVGADTPVPPLPDQATRRRLHEIFLLATTWAKKTPEGERRARFEDVAAAAALESLYLPPELRARLRTTDGRAALWIQEDPPEDGAAFVSARLYRLRGERQLRREGQAAAWVVFLLAGALFCYQRGDRGALGLVTRFGGAAAGVVFLFLLKEPGMPAEVLAPVLVVSAFAPSVHTLLGVGAAAAVPPHIYLAPALVFTMTAGSAWAGDLIRR